MLQNMNKPAVAKKTMQLLQQSEKQKRVGSKQSEYIYIGGNVAAAKSNSRFDTSEKKNKADLSNLSRSGEKMKPASQLAFSIAQLENAS